MRVPLSWLSEYVPLQHSVEELADVLTVGGVKVEAIHRPTTGIRGVVVAEVRAMQPVPGSDKLTLVEAFDGQHSWEIVCGARNYTVGDRVPAALPGATLSGGEGQPPVEIGVKRLRGVTSNGMLASARELGVGDDHRGIWVLDADAPVGADLTEWLGLDDAVLELEVNPDRGYLLSIIGVARDVAALTGADLRLPGEEPGLIGDAVPDGLVPVTIADPSRCHRFTATEIRGVRLGPSPAWLQRRLAAVGMRPISNVVDATNYAMLETGHPAHAYDRALLAGPLLEVRDARQGEVVVTLDGVARRLDADDLVIADSEGPVGLAGVMGGERTEVHEGTTDLILEVASFDAVAVLRTARRHKLFTEASTRFEKIVPDETVAYGAARCTALLRDLAGGTPVGRRDTYPGPRPRASITLRPERTRRRLGVDLDAERQAALLTSIACEVTVDDGALTIRPPAYRPDLRIEEDLYEEIARLHGYDRIPKTLPSTGRVGGRSPAHQARLAVRRALAGAGWTEVLTFPFIADDDLAALGLDADDPRLRTIPLVNPLSKEESVLRTSLLPGLFRVVRHNVNRQNADLSLFEVGHVFLPPTEDLPGAGGDPEGARLPAEPLVLGLIACGAFEAQRWDRPPRSADFADLLGAVETARVAAGLPSFEVRPTRERPYHPGRAARLLLGGEDVGVVGELHPKVVAAFELPARTLAGELRLDRLVEDGVQLPTATVPSPLPSLRFDVAVLVDQSVPAARVEAAVREGAGKGLTSLTLFDVFIGEQVGPGMKNLAYRLRLDDAERQLTDVDAHEAIERIASTVAERTGGTLRR